MDFRDTLSTLLPPPRDDEPARLRQDIIDELSDHLACGYNRELLRGVDSCVARQRVLERFGDPAAVARRLWLDAMKGKIMVNRLSIATCLVVMAACGTSVALAWRWINQDQLQRALAAAESIEANRRMTDVLAQAQATNKDMLNKLSEMSDAMRHPRSPDWNPVSFKLTEETPNGPPVNKANLVLIRSGENPSKTFQRTSDASGTADFGAIQPGDYSFGITQFFRNGTQSTTGQLNVQPGSEIHKAVVCPKAPPEKVPVRFKFAWPSDLETLGLLLYAPFTFTERTLDPGLPWKLLDVSVPQVPQGFIGMGGGLQRYDATRSVLWSPDGSPSIEIANAGGVHLWKTEKSEKVFGDILERYLRELAPGDQEVRWEAGTYRLGELMVVRPTRGHDSKMTRRFDVLGQCMAPNVGHQLSNGPPHEGVLPMIYPQIAGPGHSQQFASTDMIPKSRWAEDVDHFEARPGQINEWTIPLPDELISAVRAATQRKPPQFAAPADSK
jgi:hypothetical protein